MSDRRRVILAVMSTTMSCYSDLLRGIIGYANEQTDWRLEVCAPWEDVPGLLRRLRPHGMLLGGGLDGATVRRAMRLVGHCVGVCGQYCEAGVDGMPEVESDDYGVGTTAADHFLGKGFEHFAFVGAVDGAWSDRRGAGFAAAVERTGRRVAVLREWVSDGRTRRESNADVVPVLRRWLAEQPKPLALLACNDLLGREVAAICRDAGFRVPEEVSIIGADNDDMDCELSQPPLSSVVIPWRRLGRMSAELLGRLIAGRRVARRVHLLSPSGVAERQSTDLIAIDDADVRVALRYIRERAHEIVDVDSVATAAAMSRRMLERRFRTVLGRSPLEEIRRIHVERAKLLLARTDLTMSKVAEASGFSGPAWFSKAFRQEVGESPSRYRVRHRDGRTGGILDPANPQPQKAFRSGFGSRGGQPVKRRVPR